MKLVYHRENKDPEKLELLTPSAIYSVRQEKDYVILEKFIDKLVDFAAEIREHEPDWSVK